MATRRITIHQAPAWVAALPGKLKKAAQRGLVAAAARTVQKIQSEVIPREPRVPVDRGIYKAGWHSEPTADGARVWNDAPYAAVIEYGARAANIKIGRAMIDALAKWVLRKGLLGRSRGAGAAAEARGVAWAIAQHFKRFGIFNEGKGLRILEKATADLRKVIGEEIAREIKRELL